jgi:mycothiol synthase
MGRGYRSDADLRRMEELARAAWRELGPRVPCTPGDLQWRRNRNDLFSPEDVRLWETRDAELRGFAWRYGNGDVDFLVHPPRLADAVVPDLVAWAEAIPGPRPTFWALESDGASIAALRAAGLSPTGDAYLHFAGAAAELELSPALPAGFFLRGTDPAELEARAAVHRAAFGTERLQVGAYRRLAASPLYRPGFDVVAVAPTGELAAFALGWFDPATGTAEIEPAGTAPAFRRRGLARVVCTEALRRMREAGARTAVVYAHAADPVTRGLYASLGLSVVDRNLGFARSATTVPS